MYFSHLTRIRTIFTDVYLTTFLRVCTLLFFMFIYCFEIMNMCCTVFLIFNSSTKSSWFNTTETSQCGLITKNSSTLSIFYTLHHFKWLFLYCSLLVCALVWRPHLRCLRQQEANRKRHQSSCIFHLKHPQKQEQQMVGELGWDLSCGAFLQQSSPQWLLGSPFSQLQTDTFPLANSDGLVVKNVCSATE